MMSKSREMVENYECLEVVAPDMFRPDNSKMFILAKMHDLHSTS